MNKKIKPNKISKFSTKQQALIAEITEYLFLLNIPIKIIHIENIIDIIPL